MVIIEEMGLKAEIACNCSVSAWIAVAEGLWHRVETNKPTACHPSNDDSSGGKAISAFKVYSINMLTWFQLWVEKTAKSLSLGLFSILPPAILI